MIALNEFPEACDKLRMLGEEILTRFKEIEVAGEVQRIPDKSIHGNAGVPGGIIP